MRIRRLRKRPAMLEITAFLNLIVVLVPFLLSTAVLTPLAVIDLSLPAQSNGLDQIKGDLDLEVVVRADVIEVGDRIGGLIQRIPDANGGHDLKSLTLLLQQVKARFPDKTAVTVLAEPGTAYDALVSVLDAVRVGYTSVDGRLAQAELFPDISIGDAPIHGGGSGS